MTRSGGGEVSKADVLERKLRDREALLKQCRDFLDTDEGCCWDKLSASEPDCAQRWPDHREPWCRRCQLLAAMDELFTRWGIER